MVLWRMVWIYESILLRMVRCMGSILGTPSSSLPPSRPDRRQGSLVRKQKIYRFRPCICKQGFNQRWRRKQQDDTDPRSYNLVVKNIDCFQSSSFTSKDCDKQKNSRNNSKKCGNSYNKSCKSPQAGWNDYKTFVIRNRKPQHDRKNIIRCFI